MKSDVPKEGLFKLLIKKLKNPFYIFIIGLLYFVNDYIKIIKAKEIVIAICIILVCLVLLKDTIYKCLDRLCKRDENIEKEKTKRLLAKENTDENTPKNSNNNQEQNIIDKDSKEQNNDTDLKVYDIKRRKRK